MSDTQSEDEHDLLPGEFTDQLNEPRQKGKLIYIK